MSAAFRDDEDIFLRLPVRDGRAATRLELALEDGERRGVDLRAGDLEPISWRGVDGRVHEGLRARLPRLPLGRHIVSLEGTDCRLTVAPRRCHAPRIDGRAFGLAAQLYSLRRDGDQGVGDFTTLVATRRARGRARRGDRRHQPAARAFRRRIASAPAPIIRPTVSFSTRSISTSFASGDFFDAPNAGRLVDYPAVHALKQQFLERAFKGVEHFAQAQPGARTSQDFESFIAEGGDALFRFACFEAISERRGGEDWRRWPGPLRDGEPLALASFARENASRIRYHQYLQQLCESQFARGGARGGERRPRARLLPRSRRWRGARRLRELARRGASSQGLFDRRPARSLLRETDRTGACRRPIRCDGRRTVARVLASSCARICATPGRCASITSWVWRGSSSCRTEASRWRAPIYPIRWTICSPNSRSNPIAPNALVIGEDLGTLPWGFSERLAGNRDLELPGVVVRAGRRGLRAAGALCANGHGLRLHP